MEMDWTNPNLLSFGKIIHWVSVQDHLSDWREGNLVLWDKFCGIHYIEIELVLVCLFDQLKAQL